MKIRFFLAVGLVGCQVLNLPAFQSPTHEPLPNYDKRKSTPAPAAIVNDQRAVAEVMLQARVPTLQLDQDKRLGTPRWLRAQRGFLTGVGGVGKAISPASLSSIPANDPHRVIKAFVNEHAALFGHDASVFDVARVKRDYVTAHNGLRTVVWQQYLDDVPVYGGLFVNHITRNDELVSVSDRFVPNLNQAAAAVPGRSSLLSESPISARAAIQYAVANLGGEIDQSDIVSVGEASATAEKRQTFQGAGLKGDTYVQLVWLPLNATQLRLCWQVILTSEAQPEMFLILVDAQNGEVLLRHCLTSYISDATYNVYTSDSPSPFSPGLSTPGTFQPPIVERQLITLSALDTNASPAGWIDDGVNETRGNNVDAHLDRNDDDQPDLPRPQGNPSRVFDFPLDLNLSPTAYGNAAVVNLFYWNNVIHDIYYQLGFTEAAGNFQRTNFNRGGVGNDAVLADGQDGGGFNNANFATPPDGFPGRMQMYLFSGPNPDRDGDLDAEIMIHEYTHGLSNRLLGGGVGISELQPGGMGEGWGDFYALSLLSEPTDYVHGNYASGGYAVYQLVGLNENYYFGIRRYPYTTDMNKNPLTLKDIDPTQADPHPGIPINPVFGGGPADEVHNMGEIWCVTLWECRANMIEKMGHELGNWTMLQLVTDGMKLAPENATFLEARDAILLADEILTGGDNLAELWLGFAKRGMGYSATVPPADTSIGVKEAYDLPDYISVGVPDGIMEIKITPDPFSALFGGITNQIYVRITDGPPAVTNATIEATLSIGETLAFRNDGVAPDLTPNNAIYSAEFLAPNVVTNITIKFVITAPDKDPSTNTVSYSIIPIPTNDQFTNAVKVPAAGAVYISNNKLATLENGEPKHAGVPSATASLWWNFTPATNGPVLIDTAGSLINTIIAVYTNNSVTNLNTVVAADDVGARKQSFVYLNARTGVTYRVAVASFDSNNKGTFRLAFVPGGVPDTNAPNLTISSPLSGITVATNRIFLTGTATDPDPNPTGIRDIQVRVTRASGNGNEIGPVGSGSTTSSLISSNWTRSVGLFEGLNIISVSVGDFAGNYSPSSVIEATYRPLEPPNDIFANAIELTDVTGVSSVNTIPATKEFGEPDHAENPGGASAWWTFRAPDDGALSLTTTNSTFDTLLAVYTGNLVSQLTSVAYNDDAFEGVPGGISELTIAVRSNQVYRIAVDGYGGQGGVVFLAHEFVAGPIYRLTANAGSGGTVSPTSIDAVSNATVMVTATPAAGFQFANWTGDVTSSQNPLSVVLNSNKTITANFAPIVYTDGFESGDLLANNWSTAGAAPWIVQSNTASVGIFAARSGVIIDGQSSSLILNGNYAAGLASFSLRVSSEPGWDFLKFFLDGVLIQQWSGEIGWTSFSFPILAGDHTLEWRYVKDANGTIGMDAAFIDDLLLPVGLPIDETTPAQLSAVVLPDGTCALDLIGQEGREYLIQASGNLQDWVTIGTVTAVGGTGHFEDTDAITNQVRFYRAIVPVP